MLGRDDPGDAQVDLGEVVDGNEGLELVGAGGFGGGGVGLVLGVALLGVRPGVRGFGRRV